MASSRPVTPSSQSRRRHSQRSSGIHLMTQSPKIHYPVDVDHMPMESAVNSERFARMSDAMEELDVNMTNLQSIHSAVALGFNESFASFMYGLSITMWCVDFPGCPSQKAWEQLQEQKACNSRITVLKAKLDEQKQRNDHLRTRLSELESRPTKPNSSKIIKPKITRPTRPPIPTPTTTSGGSKKSSVPDDDSYVTNDSFVAEPNPPKRNRLSRIPQAPIRSRSPDTKKGPNLNQPPRYMRGLFDSRSVPKRRPVEREKPRFR